MPLRVTSRPIRTVLRWQLYVTLLGALVFGSWRGPHGALSATLGGWVSLSAGWVYGLIVSRATAADGGDTIRTLLRAEASKLVLIVLQLGLVLSAYKSIVLPGFFVTFAMTVLIFGMAFFVQD